MSGPPPTVLSATALPDRTAAAANPAHEPTNVLIVGVGGQGVIMVSKVLALLAQSQGFDVKQSEKDVAAQGVARAESRLKQAQEGAKAATTVSDYTRIIAPISGIIASKQADLGATVFPGQPLMTIEDDGSYQLELALPENVAIRVRQGSPLHWFAHDSERQQRADQELADGDVVGTNATLRAEAEQILRVFPGPVPPAMP